MLNALGVWAVSVESTNTLAMDPWTSLVDERSTVATNDGKLNGRLSLEHILFGVMTSGVNSRRARAAKATWCGAVKINCVFFSETADTAKDVQPVVAFYVSATRTA